MERLDHALSQLDQFYEIEDDWDSYGGLKPTKDAIESARFILQNVPYVFPRNDGGTVLEYGDGDIVVNIRPDGHVEGWD
jgi:hypothetical protein